MDKNHLPTHDVFHCHVWWPEDTLCVTSRRREFTICDLIVRLQHPRLFQHVSCFIHGLSNFNKHSSAQAWLITKHPHPWLTSDETLYVSHIHAVSISVDLPFAQQKSWPAIGAMSAMYHQVSSHVSCPSLANLPDWCCAAWCLCSNWRTPRADGRPVRSSRNQRIFGHKSHFLWGPPS